MGGPKFRVSTLSHHNFLSFFPLSLVVFSWNFGSVFEADTLKRAHLRVPALQTPPKVHEEGRKKEGQGAPRGPTLRGPTLRGPTLRGPPFGAPPLGSGLQGSSGFRGFPSDCPHPDRPPPGEETVLARPSLAKTKFGQSNFGQSNLGQCWQFLDLVCVMVRPNVCQFRTGAVLPLVTFWLFLAPLTFQNVKHLEP